MNLTMVWRHPSDDMDSHIEPEKPSVIKKLSNGISLGLPVGKLVNSPSDCHSPQSTMPYMNRIPQMQSILTIRPDQYRQAVNPLSAMSQPERTSVIHERLTHLNTDEHRRVKANSIESPPEKSDEELIEPGSPDKPFIPPSVGHDAAHKDASMEVDNTDKVMMQSKFDSIHIRIIHTPLSHEKFIKKDKKNENKSNKGVQYNKTNKICFNPFVPRIIIF